MPFMQSALQPLPPFINDKFALSIIVKLGQPTSAEIKTFMQNTYDLDSFPHALQYLLAQLKALQGHGYIDTRRDKKTKDFRLFITDEARPIVERMLNEQPASIRRTANDIYWR